MATQDEKLYLADNPALRFLAHASRYVFNWLDEVFVGKNSPATFDISNILLTLPHLEPPFDGYRIVHISDIHVDTWLGLERLKQVVELVNARQPDLIAITGDFVTTHQEETIAAMGRALRAMRASDGVLAVLGNHDYWAAAAEVRDMLNAAGIREIGNQVHTLQRGKARLHIAGVDDVYNKHDRLNHVIEHLPLGGAAILLVHVPDFADVAAATQRFDLCLSGHSHGGQLVIPGRKPLFLPLYGQKYYSGLYRVNGMYQYTTRGLGTSTFALRWNCPPEISVLTLHTPKQMH
ncbi:MAG: hypothetical protein Fur0018_16520 [Anaerolineales bacterium]